METPPPVPPSLRPPPLQRQRRRRASFQSYPPIFRGSFESRLEEAAAASVSLPVYPSDYPIRSEEFEKILERKSD